MADIMEHGRKLRSAASVGSVEMLRRLLLETDSDANPAAHLLVNNTDVYGNTALHSALCSLSKESLAIEHCLDLLLSVPGVDPTRQGHQGWTPLHVAARAKNDRALAMLLQKPEVDANMVDAYGRTALHYAAERGHVSSVARLIAAGGVAGVSIVDCHGQTAYDLAAAYNWVDCQANLLSACPQLTAGCVYVGSGTSKGAAFDADTPLTHGYVVPNTFRVSERTAAGDQKRLDPAAPEFRLKSNPSVPG